VGGLVCLTWCPGCSCSCSHGDVVVGMGFKPLKAESEGGGDCLEGGYYSPGIPRSYAACVCALNGQRSHSCYGWQSHSMT